MNRKPIPGVLLKTAFVGYLIVLTVLLLMDEPKRLVIPPTFLEQFAHFISFFLLAWLAMAARWPVPNWGVFVLLILYAMATELLQGLVGWRSCEWRDWVQDVLGIGAAFGGWWLFVMINSVAEASATADKPPQQGN